MKRVDKDRIEHLKSLAQLQRYRRNFEAFAREQVKIKSATPGEILTLNIQQRPAQQFLHAKCEEQLKEHGYIRVRGLKARQQGWSTYSEGRAFQGSGLMPNFNSLLIACDKETTEVIFGIAKFAFMQLHPMFGLKTKYDNRRELVFQHATGESRMTFVQAKELAGTGTTVHYLHTSETAKWPDKACDLLETSLMPALHMRPGTVHIDESTAFTRGDYFREKCDATRRGDDYYGWVLVPWWFDPTYTVPLGKGEHFRRTESERLLCALAKKGQAKDGVPPFDLTNEQLNFKRIRIANAGTARADMWYQEYLETYDDAWVTMDQNVYDLNALKRQEHNLRPPRYFAELGRSHDGNYSKDKVKLYQPLEAIDPNRDYVAIWQTPQEGHTYAMGVDVALGIKGGDWTVFEVFDMVSREQVAEAHIHEDPDDAGWLAVTLGMFYNMAEINVELTGPGYNTDSRLKKNFYRNLYLWRNRERIVPKLTNLTGWRMTPESKKFLIGMTRPLFSHDLITIHSKVLYDELRHFVVVPGFVQDQYYAETGDDDCVIAMKLAMAVAHDENYMEDIMPDGELRTELSAEEKALAVQTAIRAVQTAIREELEKRGPWAVDNQGTPLASPQRIAEMVKNGPAWNDGNSNSLDNLITSLKGWE